MALSIQDEWILHNRVARLVSPELLDRLRAAPEPPYDPDICEVLDFVRRNPDPALPRYVIVEVGGGFALGVRTQPAGSAPQIDDDVLFPTRGAAETAVIERRLRDYGLTI